MKLTLLCALVVIGLQATAQDTLKKTEPLYRFTAALGLGGGYPQNGGTGIGGAVEFTYQKHKRLFSAAITGVSEFVPLRNSNVTNSISSFNITYGRAFGSGSLFASVNAGLGFVSSWERGKFISGTGFIFGHETYEKITSHAVGLPIFANILYVRSRHYGIGAELYVNINSISTFYGVSICHQFGRLKPSAK